MVMNERNARVWLWLAYLASREADTIIYADDQLERMQRIESGEFDMLQDAQERFIAKADEVGGANFSTEHWRSSIDEFIGEKA